MMVNYFLDNERYLEHELFERDNELIYFWEVYNKLIEFIKDKIDKNQLKLFNILEEQLYESILLEETYYLVTNRWSSTTWEILRDKISEFDLETFAEILGLFIDDLKNLEVKELTGYYLPDIHYYLENETNSLSISTAENICNLILKEKISDLEYRLKQLIETFKKENKSLLEEIKKELDDN